jgi:hypothetical protein
MTSWIDHPRFRGSRDRVISSLTPTKYRFRRVEPVIFLCGGERSPRRDTLNAYLNKHLPHLRVFYAEVVWELIASQPGLGALKMEADLAALSDLVIVIVESPGTFTELGAFSHVAALRKKLLPVIDIQYKSADNSFIKTGPVRWIDGESDFRPTIYVSFSRILEAVDELEDRIARIPKSRAIHLTDLTESPKHLLFFFAILSL